MILLDTNVLVYALGDSHPMRRPCLRIGDAIAAGELAATTTSHVIQEFLHVYARRRSRSEAAARAADWIDLLAPTIEFEPSALRESVAWFADTDLDAVDAFLAAATFLTDDARLVSADRGFEVLEERWVTPEDLAATLSHVAGNMLS